MSLSIEYENCEGHVFRPGSKVSGTVRFSSTKDEPIAAVTLALSGRCKVKIREHLHYTTRTFRSRGYYFYKKIKLFDGGNFTHKAGDYAWPFSFNIPKSAEKHVVGPPPARPKKQLDHTGIMKEVEDQSSKDYFPFTKPWMATNDLRTHPLPDTFAISYSKFPVDMDAKVEYALIARLERPSRGSMFFRAKDIETATDFQVKAPADARAHASLSRMQKFEESQGLPPIDKTRSLGGLTVGPGPKIKSQNQMQAEDVSFYVLVPAGITALSAVPFRLIVEASFKYSASPTRALLTELMVSLASKTSTRDDSQAAQEHIAVKFEKETLCWRKEQKQLDITLSIIPGTSRVKGEIDLKAFVQTPALVPSFSTFNIARQYTLEYMIRVELGGVSTIIRRSDIAVSVLPAGSDTHIIPRSARVTPTAAPIPEDGAPAPYSKEDEANAGRAAAAARRSLPDDDALPAYKPRTSSNSAPDYHDIHGSGAEQR